MKLPLLLRRLWCRHRNPRKIADHKKLVKTMFACPDCDLFFITQVWTKRHQAPDGEWKNLGEQITVTKLSPIEAAGFMADCNVEHLVPKDDRIPDRL